MLPRTHRLAVIAIAVVAAVVFTACSPAAASGENAQPTAALGSLPTVEPTEALPLSTFVAPTTASTNEPTAQATSAPSDGSTSTSSGVAFPLKAASNTALGQILVDSNGMTLYVNKSDSATTSDCSDACAQNWPPLMSTSDQEATLDQGVSGQLGQLARADGTTQVTFNGRPLYYYKGDQNPGETSGQGIGGMWSVVVLGGSPSGSGTSATPGAESTTTP